MKVLLVDDSTLSRLTLKRILEEAEVQALTDIELFEAANGLEALEKHRTILPDIIFLDITMPHLDGIATLSTLRLTDTKVQIIMITALGSHPQITAQCLKIGANDIVAKPADKTVIVEILQKIVADNKKQEASI
ncbi:MAG: response regulator [Pelosinus sp.]|nr:response regulator [Pelosinus sp.]